MQMQLQPMRRKVVAFVFEGHMDRGIQSPSQVSAGSMIPHFSETKTRAHEQPPTPSGKNKREPKKYMKAKETNLTLCTRKDKRHLQNDHALSLFGPRQIFESQWCKTNEHSMGNAT